MVVPRRQHVLRCGHDSTIELVLLHDVLGDGDHILMDDDDSGDGRDINDIDGDDGNGEQFQQLLLRATAHEQRECKCNVLPHHCKALIKRNIPNQSSRMKNSTEEVKSTRQNTTSHVTV